MHKLISDFVRRYPEQILETLLCDRTTGRNIIWADDEYEDLGAGYARDDEITLAKIAGANTGVIKPRVAKETEQQSWRTKNRAEVFTPSWLCNQMNNDVDEVWFGRRDVFNFEGTHAWEPNLESVEFPKKKGHGWHAYIESSRLEITCGEAPFVCSRYDTVTGQVIPVKERIGFLDRKLRVVSEKTRTRKEWVKQALTALAASYGFEYQGDNLLIARINVFETFIEHYSDRWRWALSDEAIDRAAQIVSWNFWQMDGLTCAVPTSRLNAASRSVLGDFKDGDFGSAPLTLFDLLDDELAFGSGGAYAGADSNESIEESQNGRHALNKQAPLCVIRDWKQDQTFKFASLISEANSMGKKFYAVIGNPPYQAEGYDNKSFAPPCTIIS